MLTVALVVMFVIAIIGAYRYRFQPESDPAKKKRRAHFLIGFIAGQGVLWSLMLFKTGLEAPFYQRHEFIFSLTLFFVFLAMLVSLMDN